MKKKLMGILILLTTICLTGCSSSNVKLNLTKIDEEILNLTNDNFNMAGVIDKLECSDCTTFTNMEDIYDLEDTFGLSNDDVEMSIVRYNKETDEFYMVLKPYEEGKENIKTTMKDYFDDNNITNSLESEYNDHLIYIVSSDNNKVLDAIKSSKETIFAATMPVETEQMKDILDIDSSMVLEFDMKMPMMIVHSNTYIIVKPSEGNEEIVKEKIDTYMEKLEEQWSTYLPEQYELVKNRKEEKLGDYLIYIVSTDNDKVFEVIKNNQINE